VTAGTRVALYARVSTKSARENGARKQTCETQLLALRDYCKQRGWIVVEEFCDEGVSGSKASRPALNRLMAEVAGEEKKFDAVLVWKLDRFGRSIRNLLDSVTTLDAKGIAFVSLTDSIDMTSAQGRLMFHVLSAMAEFERELIRERVVSGIKRAQADAAQANRVRKAGRHRKELDWANVRARIAAGESRRSIAQSLDVSPSLLTKWLRDAVQ
jgi:DNA invertase Pin-like site-specific DNA recombinase